MRDSQERLPKMKATRSNRNIPTKSQLIAPIITIVKAVLSNHFMWVPPFFMLILVCRKRIELYTEKGIFYQMDEKLPYCPYSEYLKNKYGEKLALENETFRMRKWGKMAIFTSVFLSVWPCRRKCLSQKNEYSRRIVIHFNILLTVRFSQKEMLRSLKSTLFLAVEVNN